MSHRKEHLTQEEIDFYANLTNLLYDDQVKIFDKIVKNYQKDSQTDVELNHPILSKKLNNLAEIIKTEIFPRIASIAKLCQPFNKLSK